MNMKNIGFIGLGHMGYPMVKNLLKAGYAVKVYDHFPEAMKNLEKDGAVIAASPAAVASNADAVFTMLQTADQVIGVCAGKEGVFETLNKEAIYIDCSSIDIRDTQELHRLAREKNLKMVDAPVSGGVKGAEAATLTIMVGGEESNYTLAKKYLDHLGKKVIHAGIAGCGQAAKICNNMILGISMIAVSEAFVLAEKLGLEAQKFFEISSNASGQCWSMTSYCPAPNILENVPSSHNYQAGFAANMMLKDLGLSQAAANSVHFYTPLGAAATEIYQRFVSENNGDVDFSGVINMIKNPIDESESQ
jgi:3-hydroxyisobutyrate dehydrogenase